MTTLGRLEHVMQSKIVIGMRKCVYLSTASLFGMVQAVQKWEGNTACPLNYEVVPPPVRSGIHKH